VARILRGEIRWADLGSTRGHEQAGSRPVLILSHDVFNERSGTVIAVALTSQSQRAGFPLTHEIAAPGLPRRSWVKISQIRTLAVERIGKRIAVASSETGTVGTPVTGPIQPVSVSVSVTVTELAWTRGCAGRERRLPLECAGHACAFCGASRIFRGLPATPAVAFRKSFDG